jgi:flagellar M-ring protein FliF
VRRDAVTNYEVDKTIKVTRNATGAVKRLSAAVLVNHMALVGADGKPGKAAGLPPEQLEQVNALVREAIGYNKDRGDTVQVVNAPFTTTATAGGPELPLWKQPEMQDLAIRLAPWVALPLLALIVILGFVRPALKAVRTPPPARRLEATVQDAIDLNPPPGGAAAGAGTNPDGSPRVQVTPDPDAVPLLPTAEAARQQARTNTLEGIRQLAKADPATVANVVRSWATSTPT